MKKGKVATWIGALAVAGAVADAAVVRASDTDADLQSCIHALEVQVPSPKLSDRIWGWGDQRYAENEASGRKISAAVGEIKKIGPGNQSKMGALVTCINTAGSSEISEAGTDALARIGTGPAKRALYSLVVGHDDSIAEYAARQLRKADPGMAVNAIVQRKTHDKRRGAGMDELTRILIDVGNHDALRYLVEAKHGYALALLVNAHDLASTVYKDRIIRLMESSMRYSSGSLRCGTPHYAMYEFGRATRKLGGPVYAESVAEEFSKEMRYSCVLEWTRGIDRGQQFLNGLLGK